VGRWGGGYVITEVDAAVTVTDFNQRTNRTPILYNQSHAYIYSEANSVWTSDDSNFVL
jgi:hypothetical protein